MKNKKLVFYTIYKEDEKTKDLKYITNFDNLQQIADYLQASKQTIKNRLSDKRTIKDYVIYKDYISASDLI